MTSAVDSKSGLIPCDPEQANSCSYSLKYSGASLKIDCGCSKNEKGTSFCPKDNSGSSNLIIIYLDAQAFDNVYYYFLKYMDNKCHTLSRFTCYLSNENESLMNNLKWAEAKSYFAHVYFNAPTCVLNIPNSGYLAFIGIIMLIIFLIWVVISFHK